MAIVINFKCRFESDPVLHGDHVACDAVHGTGVAEESEPALPST